MIRSQPTPGAFAAVALLLLASRAAPADPVPAWIDPPPPARAGHAAIYDSIGDRMIVIGGSTYGSDAGSSVWSFSRTGPPAWTDLRPDGDFRGLYGPTAIYDPLRWRVVVFGLGSSNRMETWQLTLDAPMRWTQLATGGTPPDPRYGQSAIYDPVRNRMVVYGGTYVDYYGNGPLLGDVRALTLGSNPSWSIISPAGTIPIARSNHAAIYDPLFDRMVVFGGVSHPPRDQSRTISVDEVWQLSLGDEPRWKFLPPGSAHPVARSGARGVVVRGDRMLAYGGSDPNDPGGFPADEAWILALDDTAAAQWVQEVPSGTGPGNKLQVSAVWDSRRNDVVIYGGLAEYGNYYSSVHAGTWSLALEPASSWTDLTPGADPPLPRENHAAFYDSLGHRMIVALGSNQGNAYSDVWARSLEGEERWSSLGQSAPFGGRNSASMIWDSARSRIVLFGGSNGSNLMNDVWAFEPGSHVWRQLFPGGTLPAPRISHCAIYDPVGDRMIVFGGLLGFDAGTVTNEVWSLSLAGDPRWDQLAVSGPETVARYYARALYDPPRHRMITFAGFDSLGVVQGLDALSLLGTPQWSQLHPSGTGPQGYDFSTVYDPNRDQMVVTGTPALNSNTVLDVWTLSLPGTPNWTLLSPLRAPPQGRNSQTAIFDTGHDRMVVFGGYNGNSSLNDTWYLSLIRQLRSSCLS